MAKTQGTLKWPRDYLLPFINFEIASLLDYLARDDSWKGCFKPQVEVTTIIARLNREKHWVYILGEHPEISGEYIARLISEAALERGIAATHNGTEMAGASTGTVVS